MLFTILIILAILIILSLFIFFKTKETYKQIKKENINHLINDMVIDDLKKDKKLGSKSYLYDFVDGEQPLNGLGPSYEQNYPTTLSKENNMLVIPDLTVKYINLLNNKNNKYY